jgi:hypothetical protein
MATRTITTSSTERSERDVMPLVKMMTVAAWTLLGIGLLLGLFNINHFSDRNISLMVGIGFMVGSVFIYVIRTAIHLVHSRTGSKAE